MKTIKKALAILVIAMCTLTIMPQNIVKAAGGSGALDSIKVDTGAATNLASDLGATIGKFLGFLQIASGLCGVLVIAYTGFNYIISTPEMKDEMKKKFVPIVVGFVLVFGAVSVAKFILGAVGA